LKACFRIVVEDPTFAPKAIEAVRDRMEECENYASGPSWIIASCYGSLVLFSAAIKSGSLGLLGKSTMSLVVEAGDPQSLVEAVKLVVAPLPSILRGVGYVALDTSCSG